jgi:hypothetical protein
MKVMFAVMIFASLISACSMTNNENREPTGNSINMPKRTQMVELRDFGQAPELEGSVWLNTDFPLQISKLEGKVVLIDFWTFG